MMELRCLLWFTLSTVLVTISALPTSLVEELKASELRDNKVKRAHPELTNPEERGRDIPYYSKPTAIKRGAISKNLPAPDEQSLNDWDQEQSFSPQDLQSGLYNGGENPYDDKSIAEYEKGFHYGINRDKLDEALENAVLKSELYGEPAALNHYRYYGNDDRRRRRREIKKSRLDNRIKREVDLTPEELLAILTLYENEQQQKAYRRPWQRLEDSYNPILDKDDNEIGDDDEDWMDTPVYPHAGRSNDIPSGYYYDEKPQVYDKRGRWGAYAERNKRFMVSKKRNDPTRELRYLNGPNKNDFYTLSQLLSNEREPDVPLYHRLVL